MRNWPCAILTSHEIMVPREPFPVMFRLLQEINKMRIEFGEIRIGDIARQHINEVLDSNWITYGPKCQLFEKKWGELFGYPYNKAVSSGTDACLNICLSLYDFGASRGDEIITPALSFIATSNAIRAAGYSPVWVDIDRKTLNIDPDKITAAITPKTRAIQVVHTMGRPCEMDRIIEIANKFGLYVLEDCCESHGAMYNGQYIGTFGHAAAFSFYIAHCVQASESGMVSTMHEDVANVINSTRSHGRKNGDLYFDFPRAGLNSKMTDLDACIGLESLERFKDTFPRRRKNVKMIRDGLAGLEEFVYFSEEDPDNINCPHGFSITLKNPKKSDEFKEFLTNKSIHWKRNFGSISTQHGAFVDCGHKLGDFPEAEYVGDNGVHFGVHEFLSDADIGYIIDSINAFDF